MSITISQCVSVEPYHVIILSRLVDADTGEILGEWSRTYFNLPIDDCVADAQSTARSKAYQLGGVRLLYDIKVS